MLICSSLRLIACDTATITGIKIQAVAVCSDFIQSLYLAETSSRLRSFLVGPFGKESLFLCLLRADIKDMKSFV